MADALNNPNSGTGSSGGKAVSSDSMAREADVIAKKFDQLRALQAQGRRTYQFLTVIIILMFAVFMYATWTRIRDNFNQDAVQAAFAHEMPEEMATAGTQLMKAGYTVMPTYRDLLVQRMNEQGPQLADKAQAEFSRVPQEAGEAMEKKLQTAFAASLDKIKPDLEKAYPGLTDEQKQSMMTASFTDAVNSNTQSLTDHVQTQYTSDLEKFDDLLTKFDLPPANAPIDRDSLTRSFLHEVVMLIDMNVMESSTPAAAPTAPAASAR